MAVPVSDIRQSLANIAGQRQPLIPMAFAVEDELTCSPIDIVELEGRDFTATKSESREQKQDSEITATHVAAAIAALQKQPKLSR